MNGPREVPANSYRPGSLVDGRYRVVNAIAGGAMSLVYRCSDEVSGDDVAVKILPTAAADEVMLKRFRREIEICQGLVHDHLVRIRSHGLTADGSLYYVMDFIPWPSLHTRGGSKVWPEARVRHVLRQLASGLAYLHDNEVVHRDVKPANILLSPDDRLVLVDLGLASDGKLTQVTATGQFIGTPLYAAPEVLNGERSTFRSDQFSFGVVAYELLTGANPIEPLAAALFRPDAEHPKVPSVGGRRTSISSGLRDLVDRCLARNPDDRYDSMHRLEQDLVALGRKAKPGALREQTAVRRHKQVRRACLAFCFIILSLIGFRWLQVAGFMGTTVVEPTIKPSAGSENEKQQLPPVSSADGLTLLSARRRSDEALVLRFGGFDRDRGPPVIALRLRNGDIVEGSPGADGATELTVAGFAICAAAVLIVDEQEQDFANWISRYLRRDLTELAAFDLETTIRRTLAETVNVSIENEEHMDGREVRRARLSKALRSTTPLERLERSFRRVSPLAPLLLGTELWPSARRERVYRNLIELIELSINSLRSYDAFFDLRPLPDLGPFSFGHSPPEGLITSRMFVADDGPVGLQALMRAPVESQSPGLVVEFVAPEDGVSSCWFEFDGINLRHMLLFVSINDGPPLLLHDSPYYPSPTTELRRRFLQSIPPWWIRPGPNTVALYPQLRWGSVMLRELLVHSLSIHYAPHHQPSDSRP